MAKTRPTLAVNLFIAVTPFGGSDLEFPISTSHFYTNRLLVSSPDRNGGLG